MTKMATVQAQQRWEYCFQVRKTEPALLIVLNEFGQSGWELVDTIHHKDQKGDMCWTAFFKRPSVGPPPPSESHPANVTIAAPSGPTSSSGPTEEKRLPPPENWSDEEYKVKTP
jgi:hypothetical protein